MPACVRFVQPHLNTKWSHFSLVEATLAALRLLYQTDDMPDWFVLLSGADYPIKPAEKILAELQTVRSDALIRYRLIEPTAQRNSWERNCLHRYCCKTWRVSSKWQISAKEQLRQLPWWLSGPWLPFSQNFRCYAGSHFFTANASAAEYLLANSPQQRQLARHYAEMFCPEESYFQCLLCNAPHLTVVNDNYRYIDWSIDGPHPKTLTSEDLPRLLASKAHFARKFDIERDQKVLDQIDEVILPSQNAAGAHAA